MGGLWMEEQHKIINKFHKSWCARHRGTWVTFAKIKGMYWWKGMYKDVVDFVGSCKTCQMYSNVRHMDGLHLTFLLAIHYKWVVDLVAMSMGLGQKKYLVLAREDLSNQVEGRALRPKRLKQFVDFFGRGHLPLWLCEKDYY